MHFCWLPVPEKGQTIFISVILSLCQICPDSLPLNHSVWRGGGCVSPWHSFHWLSTVSSDLLLNWQFLGSYKTVGVIKCCICFCRDSSFLFVVATCIWTTLNRHLIDLTYSYAEVDLLFSRISCLIICDCQKDDTLSVFQLDIHHANKLLFNTIIVWPISQQLVTVCLWGIAVSSNWWCND